MKTQHIIRMIKYDSTHDFIFDHLDSNLREYVVELLENLDWTYFKEIVSNGEFEFYDLPIPYEKIAKNNNKLTSFSDNINSQLKTLLSKINKEGTNVEYSYFLVDGNGTGEYTEMIEMPVGKKQNCTFDWQKISEYISTIPNGSSLALFHTHPKAIGQEHKTLYNKDNRLKNFGVKPEGLNLSLADVYACQYLDVLAKRTGKKINVQSVVLMHDGTLVAFSNNEKPSLDLVTKFKLNSSEIIK